MERALYMRSKGSGWCGTGQAGAEEPLAVLELGALEQWLAEERTSTGLAPARILRWRDSADIVLSVSMFLLIV